MCDHADARIADGRPNGAGACNITEMLALCSDLTACNEVTEEGSQVLSQGGHMKHKISSCMHKLVRC